MSNMFIVLLKFSANKTKAADVMARHNEWLRRGFNDGVFQLSGSLKPGLGGGILAQNTTLAELEKRVAEDPFVVENIVKSEILELAPGKAADRFSFLLGEPAVS